MPSFGAQEFFSTIRNEHTQRAVAFEQRWRAGRCSV
jgi:hypothetical protein